MCQSGESGAVEGLDQKADGDADTFGHVVVFESRAVGEEVIVAAEDDDEPWGVCDVRLDEVGAERSQGFEPFGRGFLGVELLFFGFSGFADLGFDVGVGDGDELPRLAMSSRGGSAGDADGSFNGFAGDGIGREMADGVAGLSGFEVFAESLERLLEREAGWSVGDGFEVRRHSENLPLGGAGLERVNLGV